MIYRNFQNLPYLLTKEEEKIEKKKKRRKRRPSQRKKAIPRIDISGLATKNIKSLISRAMKVKVISTLAWSTKPNKGTHSSNECLIPTLLALLQNFEIWSFCLDVHLVMEKFILVNWLYWLLGIRASRWLALFRTGGYQVWQTIWIGQHVKLTSLWHFQRVTITGQVNKINRRM